MLAVLFQKHFAHQLPWWFLSRVTSTSWMCCKVGALVEVLSQSLHLGVSLLCVPWWSISGNPDWMPSHSHCVCRDWISSTMLFMDVRWEPSVLERSSHIQNIHAVSLPYEWTAADCVLWGHWSLIHPYHIFRASCTVNSLVLSGGWSFGHAFLQSPHS